MTALLTLKHFLDAFKAVNSNHYSLKMTNSKTEDVSETLTNLQFEASDKHIISLDATIEKEKTKVRYGQGIKINETEEFTETDLINIVYRYNETSDVKSKGNRAKEIFEHFQKLVIELNATTDYVSLRVINNDNKQALGSLRISVGLTTLDIVAKYEGSTLAFKLNTFDGSMHDLKELTKETVAPYLNM